MKRLNLTSKTFGRLTVVRPGPSVRTKSGGYAMWECRCSCGGSTKVRTSHLTEHRVQSCGCLLIESLSTNPRAAKAPGAAYLRYVFGYYEKNARLRKLPFKLTFDAFCQTASQLCHYCGAPPEQGKNKSRLGRPSVFNGVIKHNGVDRIDSSKGYTEENVVPCCKACNYAKRQMTTEEFRSWIRRVHAHFCATD